MSTWPTHAAALAAFGLMMSGCGDQNKKKSHDDHASDQTIVAPAVEHAADAKAGEASSALESGEMNTALQSVSINATEKNTWVYFDLETASITQVEDPATNATWDIGFKRSEIKTNGGLSGQGGVEVAIVPGDASGVLAAPAGPYISDKEPGADFRTASGYAFHAEGHWFDYNFSDHSLKAKRRTYVVKTGEHRFFRVQIKSYYDDAGSPAHIGFVFSEIPAAASFN